MPTATTFHVIPAEKPAASAHRADLDRIERTFREFLRKGDASGAYRSWAAAVQNHLLLSGDPQLLDPWLDSLSDLKGLLPEIPDQEAEAEVAAAALLAFMNRRPADPELADWETRASDLVLSPLGAGIRLRLGCSLLLWNGFWAANPTRARLLVDVLRPLAVSEEADPSDRILWYLGEASTFQHSAEVVEARAACDRGLALSESCANRLWVPLLLLTRIKVSLSTDDLGAADRDLRSLSLFANGMSRSAVWAYHSGAAAIFLRKGDARRGTEHARAALRSAALAGHSLASANANASWAIAIACHGGVGPSLDEALRDARRAKFTYGESSLLFVAASVALSAGREREAAEFLAVALGLFVGPDAACLGRAELAELCAFALERAIEPDAALDLVRRLRLAPTARARRVAAWPWPIRIETLDDLTLVCQGVAQRRAKMQRKQMDLLRLLVASGPKGARVEAVADALWPDSDGDLARHALETALYRLRKLLKNPAAVLQRDGRLLLAPDHVFVDAWALQRETARAQSSQKLSCADTTPTNEE